MLKSINQNSFGAAHLPTNLIAGMHFWPSNKKFIGVSHLQWYNILLVSECTFLILGPEYIKQDINFF